ncbi:MAG: choice-of-anchor Q domain-containing protein [Acidobacteriota bacterium]
MSPRLSIRRLVLCVLAASGALAVIAPPTLAGVGTIVVDGSCSLSDAIRSANTDTDVGACVGAGGAENIVLDVDVVLAAADLIHSTSQLGSFAALPDITSPMTIRSGAARSIVRDLGLGCTAADQFRLVNIVGGDLTLIDLVLENGCAFSHGGAAVVLGSGVNNGRLHAQETTFRGHTAGGLVEGADGLGGAIYVGPSGEVPSIEDSLFEDNLAQGGFGGGVDGGEARGGAIAFSTGATPAGSILETTFAGNRAVGGLALSNGGFAFGGGIASERPLGLVRQSTFEANEALAGDGNDVPGEGSGGGLYLRIANGAEPTELVGLLFRGNRAVGGGTTAADVVGGAGIAAAAYLHGVPGAPITLESSRMTEGLTQGGSGAPAGDGRCAFYALTATTVRSSTSDHNVVRGGSSTFSFGGSAFGGGGCGDDDSLFSAVTFSSNRVEGGPSLLGVGGFAGGGGFSTFGTAELRLRNVTMTNNRAIAGPGATPGESRAGGLYFAWFSDFRGSLLAGNWIVDVLGNEVANDCSINQFGASAGFNIVQNPGDCLDNLVLPGDQVFLDPELSELQRFGCTTTLPNGFCAPTHALPLASPAIDTGSCDGAPAVDGRGFSRPVDIATTGNADDGCDVGAYEARDEDGSGEDDGIEFVFVFADGFESGSTAAWSATVP